MKTPFLGGFDVVRSSNAIDSQLLNLYLEIAEGEKGRSPGTLYGTPGLTLFATCGGGPVNGMHVLGGSLHVISNNNAYIVDTNGTVSSNGTMGASPISDRLEFIESAGEASAGPTQTRTLAAFTRSAGYYSTGAGWSAITLPSPELSAPLTAATVDTYGLLNQTGTNIWWQSDALDLTTWDALNFSFADALPSNLVAIRMMTRQLWLLKSDSVEIWVNVGTAGFAFQRLDGPFLHRGCAAAFSAVRVVDNMMWLSLDKAGQGQILRAKGYEAIRASNHGIENEISKYTRIDDAFAYTYQQNGHDFYVITFPTANATWVYDLTASDQVGFPIWHRRGVLNQSTGAIDRHPGNCYTFFSGRHLIGDYRNGNIYSLDLNALTDNGVPRKWLRTWRALPEEIFTPARFNSLQISMQTGLNVAGSPQCSLRWSDDGGHVWSNPVIQSVGSIGKTGQRVKFNRLGSTKRNTGLDRIFELSSTDAFPVALFGAELN